MTQTPSFRKRIKRAFAGLALGLSLVGLSITSASATSETVSGDLDGYYGSLTEYSTFRYHYNAGSFTFRPDDWSFNSLSNCGRFLRLGLRISSGVQWSDSVEWKRTSNVPIVDERGVTKSFTRSGSTYIAANYYAFNGRTSASNSTSYCGSGGVVNWYGEAIF